MNIIPEAPVKVTGLPFEGYNALTLYNTWLVMAALFLFGWLIVRRLQSVPGRMQAAGELIAEFFEDLCNSTLGKEHGRGFVPFIATLFLFVLLCNVIGTIPNVLGWTGWQGFSCPTQDLNTPLGLALIVLFVVHISAIRVKGFGPWLWSFYEPSFPADRIVTKVLGALFFGVGGVLIYVFVRKYTRALPAMGWGHRIGLGLLLTGFIANAILLTCLAFQFAKIPNVAMAPLNVVGELGKAISHPFRLFGNIFGGFVILTVVLNLVHFMDVPPVLRGLIGGFTGLIHAIGNIFFGLFIGLVHAFVFAMLALAYTAVQIRD